MVAALLERARDSVRDASAPVHCNVKKKLHNCHFEVCGLLFWEEAEARILLLWLIDLTLGLLLRICHARSDLLSASFRILFWQHLSKLDFQHLLGFFSRSFITTAQLHRLNRLCAVLSSAVRFQQIPFPVLFPLPESQNSLGNV